MRKRLLILLTAIIGAATFGAAIYHFVSPKVVLVNDSASAYDELVVALPSSRVSFGPVPPTSRQAIYFASQRTSGTVFYTLRASDTDLSHGTLPYDVNGQFFRTITIIIRSDGSVFASSSG